MQFPGWEAINITKPDTSDGQFMPYYNRTEVQRKLAELQTPRNLAVVVCNNVYPADQQAEQIAAWNSILGGLGYHRAIYLRGPTTPNLKWAPIIKDQPLCATSPVAQAK